MLLSMNEKDISQGKIYLFIFSSKISKQYQLQSELSCLVEASQKWFWHDEDQYIIYKHM